MRTTLQCGRNGSATHNEHRHIDTGARDVVVRDMTGALPGTPLRDAELDYYRRTFGPALEEQNARHRAARHYSRVKTIDQLYAGPKTRPEESIIQVGKKGAGVGKMIFDSIVKDLFRELNKWNRRHGRPFQTLDTAIHYDETTIHLHWRKIWQYEGPDGLMHIGQSKALERAGVPLPHPEQPEGRYNNRKMTFDAFVRETLQQICIDHGLQIETDPLPARRHKGTEEYIDQQIEAKTQQLWQLNDQISHRERQLNHLTGQIEQEAYNLANLREQASEAQDELTAIDNQIAERQRRETSAGKELARSLGFDGHDLPGR